MGTSLTGNNISQSYLGLLKSTDSQALGSTAKRLTDGAGNDTPLYLSTSRLGIGVASPSRVLDVSGDIEVNNIRIGKGGGSISTNTVFGQNAINNSSNTGAGNVAIGHSALIVNTSGSFNVGIGLTPLVANTTGQKNIAIGNDSLESNQTGSSNTAIGNETLKELSSGGHNIAIGNDAGNGITTGSQSIIIGSQADASDVTSQNEIVIGYNLSGNGSNTVTIGNSSILNNYFNGNIRLGNSASLIFGTSDVYISGTTVSDNIQLGVGGATQFTFAQTTGLRLHQYGSGSITGTVTQRLGVTSTGQVVEIPIGAGALDGSGTAGRVAKFTDSDTLGNSGISDSSNALAITINGNEEVGIGVSPLSVLHIGKPSGSTNLRIESGTASSVTGTSTITMISRNASSGTSPSTKIESVFEDSHDSALAFHTSDGGTEAEKMRLTSAGILGINLTNPAGHLHVAGNTSGAGQIYISDADNGVGAGDSLLLSKSGVHGIIENRDSGDLRMGTNDDNTFLVIKPSGNVAIGGTTANAKLHISGISQTGTVNAFKIENDTSNTKFAIDSVSGDYKLQFKNASNTIKVLLNSSGDSYLNGGNVGIGSDTPNHLLDVESAGASMRLLNTTSDANTELYINTSGNTGIAKVLFGDTSDPDIGQIVYRNNGNSMAFVTDDLERMRIMNDGDVGIGVNSPTVRLQISKGAIHEQLRVHRDVNGDSTTMGSILFAGDDSDGNITDYARIHGLAESDNAGSEDGALVFSTLLNNSFSERMRITSAGDVGISTSTPTTLLDLGAGNTQGDGIGFGSNITEIRRGNSGTNLQMSHWGNISMIIDSDNNDSSRFFNVMHGNNDSASATELFRVQETGEVLIGTTSASSIFTLKYDDATSLENNSASGMTIRNTNNTSGSGATITFEHTDSNSTGVIAKIGGINNSSTTDDNGILTFSTRKIGVGMVRHMTIDENGYVGIGTTSIDRPLHVESHNDAPIQVESTDDTTGILFKDNNSSNALFYRGVTNYFYTTSRFNLGDIAATASSTALGVSATSFNSGNTNGQGEDEFLALFQAGTNSVYKQRYIKIAQTFTGGAKKSPIIAFEANHDGDNHKSYGTIGVDTDGSFQFSNIADQSSAIAPGTEIPVTQKMKIESDGRVIINDDANIQGTTFSAGFLNFNSSGNVRLSANNDVRIGYSGAFLTVKNTGLVGIGTTTPNSYNAAGNHLVIAGTGNTGLTIAGGTSNDSNIFFADGTSGADAYRGILRYQHSDNSMLFFTNATERIKITNTGEITLSNSDGIRLSPQVSNLYTVSGSLSFYGTDNAVYLNGAGANGHLRLNAAGGENGRNTIDIFGSSASPADTINFRTVAGDRARFNGNGVLTVGSTNVQTQARLNVRENGSGIEFGHTNTSDFYFGTLGSLGSNGSPFISWSCMNEHNVNTFTTKGAKGNLIRSNTAGELVFQQVTATNTTGQTPVTRMTLDSSGQLGIGTNNPLSNIHSSTSDDVTALFQSTDSISRIEFADNNTTGTTRPSIGAIGNSTIFTQGAVERMRLASDGDFLLGKTGNNIATVGIELRENGLITASRDAGTPMISNREGTVKGNIIDLRQDNSPVIVLGTTGDNVFVGGTANSDDLLLRTNSTNRIRILDYGLTKFDTYGSVTTTPEARMHQHQIFTMSCTAATSTTAKAMANVGTTNAFDYTIIARIDATNIGSTTGRTATANGTNSGFFDRQAFNGNVTAITPTYNASSDTLDVAVTYSGLVAPTVHITINGISDVDISRTGGCST